MSISREEAIEFARVVGRDSGKALKVTTIEVLIEDLWWMARVEGSLDGLLEPEGPLTESEIRQAWEEGLREVAYGDKIN